MVLAVWLLLLYTKHAAMNQDLTEAERSRWIGILFYLNVFSMPFYFLKYVWNRSNRQ